MNIRRSAAALAAVAVIGSSAPAVAAGASPSPSASSALPSALYGRTDPQYDGVWRQSLVLLAQHTAGVRPAAEAVDWLAGQQCASGAFAPFRADPAHACDAKVMVDTNSTAAAVQALVALGGHGSATGKAVSWLKSVQNKDGGWGYTPGGPSDTNSTSVVIGALAATGEKPTAVLKDRKSPFDALLKLALPCSGGGAGEGAFAYQPDKKGKLAANADATAAGVVAALGQGLAAGAASGKGGADATHCSDSGGPTPARAAANGASYLAHAVAKTGYLTSVLPGATDQPDYGNTADAVVALAAQGGAGQARKPLQWLEKHAGAWAEQSGPAAYAQLIFAAHATGTDPHAFGGTDLVEKLNATGPAPQAATAKGTDQATEDSAKNSGDSGSGFGVWWFIGVCLVAGIGIGFLFSMRNRAGRQP